MHTKVEAHFVCGCSSIAAFIGVGALLVVFSRNHNFIARKLLELNENGRFTVGPGLMTEAEQDEALFQTARLVNGGW